MKHLLILLLLIFPAVSLAHDGSIDKYGCHHDDSTHTYHCHNGILRGLEFDNEEHLLSALQDNDDAKASAPDKTYDVLGKVISITDGDTISILVNKKSMKIRLAEIDAPEQNQDYGIEAKKYIEKLILGKQIRANVDDVDDHGRLVGHVYLNKLYVNACLIDQGYAWTYLGHINDSKLIRLEAYAREHRRGLWSSSNPVPPWEWRHRKPYQSE